VSALADLLRGESERLAREAYEALDAAWVALHPTLGLPWSDNPHRDVHIAAHLALLTDLQRPASRDALVRLCIERDVETWTRRPLPYLTNRDAIAHRWHALRDDPEALERAALNTFGATTT
jgi:hypothetical protein